MCYISLPAIPTKARHLIVWKSFFHFAHSPVCCGACRFPEGNQREVQAGSSGNRSLHARHRRLDPLEPGLHLPVGHEPGSPCGTDFLEANGLQPSPSGNAAKLGSNLMTYSHPSLPVMMQPESNWKICGACVTRNGATAERFTQRFPLVSFTNADPQLTKRLSHFLLDPRMQIR